MNTFSHGILEWYNNNKRDLPWRTDNSPYRVLISEIMLQQTQVPRVIEKFHEFLMLFPTLRNLANASKADVIKAWSGLGYNRRALLLHKFAQVVVEKHDAIIPSTPEELIELPGIGPYAAGSIASFAFNLPAPAIDVNVRRIFHRYFDGKDQGKLGSKEEERVLFSVVKDSIPDNKSCDFHNALMDFGSLVCKRNTPLCTGCPLFSSCKFGPLYDQDKATLHKVIKAKEKGVTELGRHVPNRIFRGRIVEWVRKNENVEISVTDLGSQIKKDFNKEEEWLLMLITKLQQDHLLTFAEKNGSIKLEIAK
ncbi:TPA: A/G-specific adenine glycosylase [Candidatus Woesearchaeota archaeon]|nr:Fe-S cluster assembly protein HesB [archaeon]HIJ10514.1 A/G-specific adenine glycosylase [Candidatus Woesearchaeota archaeon]